MTESQPTRIPGLALAVVLALLAGYLNELPFPPFTVGAEGRHPIDTMLLAIVLGIAVRNLVPLAAWWRPGSKYAVHKILPFAIVLMGAKLDFFDVIRVSSQALIINVTCVTAALVLTIWLCHKAGVTRRLGLLIGVGTAICGGTAIAVVAPVVEARDDETAFAITTITLFGLASIVAFPVIGGLLSMTEVEFGVWAGTSIHATAQVMAAAFAFGPVAGDIAVIVKLVRVLLLAPIVVIIGALYAREKRSRDVAHVSRRTKLTTLFPPFIFGFVALALANTLALLPDITLHLQDSFLWEAGAHDIAMATLATETSSFLITVAMAGVGLGVHLRGLARVGLRALYVGLFAAVIMAGFSLVLLHILL